MKQEIRKLLGTEKLIIGSDRTMKALRAGELSKVVLSANCPAKEKEAVNRLAELGSTIVEELTQDNEELGVLCKKPFRISMLGVK